MKTDLLEEVKKIRTCILALRADMQVQMTDNSQGEIFSAVPTSIVNQWFDILEKKVTSQPTQQKDAGEDWEERYDRFIEDKVHYIVIDKEDPRMGIYAREDIKAFISRVATQARRQAFQECLEAVGNDEGKQQIEEIKLMDWNEDTKRRWIESAENRDAVRKEIRASIEKLKHT